MQYDYIQKGWEFKTIGEASHRVTTNVWGLHDICPESGLLTSVKVSQHWWGTAIALESQIGSGNIDEYLWRKIDFARSIPALLHAAVLFSSWYSYDLIAKQFGEEEGLALVYNYERQLKSHLLKRVIECPPLSSLHKVLNEFESISVKVDWEYESAPSRTSPSLRRSSASSWINRIQVSSSSSQSRKDVSSWHGLYMLLLPSRFDPVWVLPWQALQQRESSTSVLVQMSSLTRYSLTTSLRNNVSKFWDQVLQEANK